MPASSDDLDGRAQFTILALDGAGHHGSAAVVRALLIELRRHRTDLAAAAGECLVDLPEPGTDVARLLRANVILRRQAHDAEAQADTVREAARTYLAAGDAMAQGMLAWHSGMREARTACAEARAALERALEDVT